MTRCTECGQPINEEYASERMLELKVCFECYGASVEKEKEDNYLEFEHVTGDYR